MNDYAQELGKVLKSFDTTRMRGFIAKHKEMLDEEAVYYFEKYDDQFVLGAMAKMIMCRTDMSVKDRNIAMTILDKMGWDYEIN
ncbi:MAG: hypothetical protein IJH05_03575 [Firmicutes bacterium]|nr:hypothetical protein [Bacillota bacterium]